jgi:hypothetical protein
MVCGNTTFLLTYFDGRPRRIIYDNFKALVESPISWQSTSTEPSPSSAGKLLLL